MEERLRKLDLGKAISVFANIGVIAGIVFLVLELSQNNELMIDEAERARAESRRQHWRLLAENTSLVATIVKERNGEPLSEVEEVQLIGYHMRDLIGFQTSFQQLPREDLLPAGTDFRQFYEASPAFRKAWEQYRDSLDPDFVQFMEQDVFRGP